MRFHFARLWITSQSIAYRLASFCCSGVSSEKGLGVIPRGIYSFGTLNRTGDLDSEPSSSSFTPVPDLKAIGAVCYSSVGK
jgi:hypothetical protein